MPANTDLTKGDLRLQSALSISQLAIINRLHIQKINRNQKEIMLSGDIKDNILSKRKIFLSCCRIKDS